MGIFYIAEANRKIKTLELKAYDAMLNLDKNFDKGLSSAFPYDFLSLLSKDREGKLRLIPYGIADNKTVDSRHRFSSTFSDFVTRYTAVSSTNKRRI